MPRLEIKALIAVAIAALLTADLCASAEAAQSGTSWPELLGDAVHSSYSSDAAISNGVASQFGIKWMANLYSTDIGSPVVAYNAVLNKTVVYAGNQRGDLFAVDAATGQMLWSQNLGVNDKVEASPMVAPDGSVWAGTQYNPTLFKLDGATGAIDCSTKALLPINGSPTYGTSNGTRAVFWDYIDDSATQGPLIATNENDCTQIFSFAGFTTHAGSWTTPALGTTAGGEPLAIIGTADPDSTEYAVDANTGAPVWKYKVSNPSGTEDIGAATTISGPGNNGITDGAAYVTTKAGVAYALDLGTGSVLWQFQIAPGSQGAASRSSGALDGNSYVFGYGHNSGFGGNGGVYALNASTGSVLWQYPVPAEVLSSPAIVGPTGSEVVAFGDLTGAFQVLDLASGNSLYKSQTGGYIISSPAEANGQIYIASSDGFLYAYGPGGSNASRPSTAITSPANQSTIPNPNGTLTITGSTSDSAGVNAVEVAVQQNGTSGQWYNASTGSFNPAPVRNAATVASPGSTTSTWSFNMPVPASGATYKVVANSVNGTNLVDRGTTIGFTVSPSNGEPTVKLSSPFVSPGTSFTATSTGFSPGESVTFSIFGSVVATVVANGKGTVPKTTIHVPASSTFGPTSLTLTGQTSGKTTSAVVTVTNNWTQSGRDPQHNAAEPNDSIIQGSVEIGNGTVLSQSWLYQASAPVNSSPSVVNSVAYFGNDVGVLSAVVTNTGAPKWILMTPSGAPIRTTPAVDPLGNVLFASSDGNLYIANSAGTLAQTVTLGGNLTSADVDKGQAFVASDNGNLYSVAEPAGTIAWTSALSGPGHSTPAYDAVKSLVIAGDDSGAITAFNSTTGAQVWKTTTGGPVTASPLILKGYVYIGSGDGKFYSINEATGAVAWTFSASGAIQTGAAVYNGTSFSIGDANGIYYQVSKSGAQLYKTDTRTKSPIVGISDVQGNSFVEMANGTIGMVRIGASTPFAWTYTTGAGFTTAPAIVDGTVYFGAGDGNLYAFTPQGANPVIRVGGPVITITNGSWTCTTR